MNISMFYEKEEQSKVIRDLTYHIGNVAVDIKNSNENSQDIDIALYTYNDAKYIRKEMQVNSEELYYIYIYINIYANTEKDLEFFLNKTEAILSSKGIKTRRANFREEQVFKACLPIMENNIDIKNAAKRNILTSGLLATYPFITSSIFDEEGIFIGKNIYNDSLIFIDRYNTDKYKNANMCIFGTSGAGKSFYTKLLILRCRMLGIEQFVIDPDREYENLAKKLDAIEEYTIERFEENIVVLENRENQKMINVGRDKIPEGVKEGDIVRVINGKILKDEKKTEEVSERIKNKMDDLWN